MTSKIIVIDDDPTGSQTVHSCPLLTRWTPEILEAGLGDPSPLLFILSNTRALPTDRAAEVTREICRNLKGVLGRGTNRPIYVSRSDSTLRGHYPLETDVIAEELGPFDAHFLVPAFFEGGRVTVHGIHYLAEGNRLVRTDATEYARDSVFGYSTSYLPAYVEEKTAGRVPAEDVLVLPVESSPEAYLARLMPLEHNRCVVVDSSDYDELGRFADGMLRAVGAGKRFFLRSAASIVSALAALPPQPTDAREMWRLRRSEGPGVVIVGSHVRRTSDQLEALLRLPDVVGVELDIERLPQEAAAGTDALLAAVSSAQQAGKTAVVYTSRRERTFASSEERLEFGRVVVDVLVAVVRELPQSTSFLISKGGITSNEVLKRGLGADLYRVQGQIVAGCTVVRVPQGHRLSGLPVVIFPGNVGKAGTLVEVFELLRGTRQ